MASAVLANRVGMSTATTGTGTITLGSALGAVSINVASWLSFATGGITDGQVISYLILDSTGTWEVGTGTYTSSGTTLSRTPIASSNGGAAITLSGSSQVFISPLLSDLLSFSIGSTGNAALRTNGTGGRTVQGSALLIADTTGSLSRSGNGGIPVQGTNTNDSAAAGYVGEVIESSIASGSAVSLTSGVTANITSISLTAGDWDAWGNIVTGGSGTMSDIRGAISTTSATLPTLPNGGAYFQQTVTYTAGNGYVYPIGRTRLLLSATTTVYLVIQVTWVTSTNSAYGYLGARRAR